MYLMKSFVSIQLEAEATHRAITIANRVSVLYIYINIAFITVLLL